MRKRIITTALCVTAISLLAACGGKDDTPTPTPTPTVTQQPSATPEPTAVPTPEVNVEEQIQAIHEAVKEAYGENYRPNMQVQEEEGYMSEMYGLNAEWYDAAIAEISMISTHVDTLIVVHAKEGNLENVQTALTTYQDNLKSDTFQYPMNLPKIQGSRVETIGDYVCFIMLGYVDDTAYDTDEALIAAFSDMNQLAVDAITKIVTPDQAQ